jgi:hypothetical protein
MLDKLHKRVLSVVKLQRHSHAYVFAPDFNKVTSTRSITLAIYDIAYVLLLFDWHLFLSLLEEGSLELRGTDVGAG